MGQLNLANLKSVYIDTSVVIYTVEANPSYYSLLQPLWEKFQIGEIELVTSELTLMETLVLPIKRNNQTLGDDYRILLESTQIRLVPIDREIIFNAAELRARTNLKTPDAIHAATAIHTNCDLFLTNDRAFHRIAATLEAEGSDAGGKGLLYLRQFLYLGRPQDRTGLSLRLLLCPKPKAYCYISILSTMILDDIL